MQDRARRKDQASMAGSVSDAGQQCIIAAQRERAGKNQGLTRRTIRNSRVGICSPFPRTRLGANQRLPNNVFRHIPEVNQP